MKLNYDELNDKMKKLVNTAIDAKKEFLCADFRI